jgi:ABC-2 type transport system ATP-binding protein
VSEVRAIEVKRLKKSYHQGFLMKKTLVLHGFSFTVPSGEIFGFLGANGAGKTTSIKIALGLQAPDEGEVLLLGRSSRLVSSRENVGYLPERPYFQLNFTANEFLNFHRGLLPESGRKRMVNEELFSLVGLEGIGSHFLQGFSKGMLQRIGIAQSLIHDPDLLILDEPMSGLDPVGRKEVRNLILDLNRRGKTIFFSSHIISDIEAICSQIAFLEKGHLKYNGRVDELLRSDSQEYEILFQLGASNSVNSLPQPLNEAKPFGNRHRIVVQGAERAKRAVQACWAEKCEVLGFSPVQKSLEEVLFGGEKAL